MSSFKLKFESLFNRALLSLGELQSSDIVVLKTTQGFRVARLDTLKTYFQPEDTGASGIPWTIISSPQTLAPGMSYLVNSSSSGIKVTLPSAIPVGTSFVIHAKSGPVNIDLNNWNVDGTDGALSLDDGESVYFIVDVAGHLEII